MLQIKFMSLSSEIPLTQVNATRDTTSYPKVGHVPVKIALFGEQTPIRVPEIPARNTER